MTNFKRLGEVLPAILRSAREKALDQRVHCGLREAAVEHHDVEHRQQQNRPEEARRVRQMRVYGLPHVVALSLLSACASPAPPPAGIAGLDCGALSTRLTSVSTDLHTAEARGWLSAGLGVGVAGAGLAIGFPALAAVALPLPWLLDTDTSDEREERATIRALAAMKGCR
jgi:hypothetical protein